MGYGDGPAMIPTFLLTDGGGRVRWSGVGSVLAVALVGVVASGCGDESGDEVVTVTGAAWSCRASPLAA